MIPETKKAKLPWKRPELIRDSGSIAFEKMFSPPIDAIGIVLGKHSGGLSVRDFDDPDAYESWRRQYPEIASVQPTSKTGRGWHVFGIDSRPDANVKKVDHGEYRSNGGYVVAPPSVHTSGARYHWWIEPRDMIPEMPASLLPQQWGGLPKAGEYNSLCEPDSQPAAESISEAIRACVCWSYGERNDKRWELARRLRSMLPVSTPPDVLLPYFKEWFARSFRNMRKQEFGSEWADFQRNFQSVRHPFGASLRAAKAAADNTGGTLDSLCLQLQTQWGDKPFYLSCRTAADYMQCSYSYAARMLRQMVKHGILTVHSKGVRGKERKAAYYLYNPRETP